MTDLVRLGTMVLPMGKLDDAKDGARDQIGLLAEFWQFMKQEKKWWLGPIVVVLLLVGLLIVFTQGSALAPFIYTIF